MFFNVNLIFNGNCQEAFDFYHEVLGGQRLEETILYKDIDPEVPQIDQDKVFYTELSFGDFVMRGQDNVNQTQAFGDSNLTMNLDFDSQLVGEEIYHQLSHDGTIIEPLEPVFDDLTYGKFIDKFGIMWEILIHR